MKQLEKQIGNLIVRVFGPTSERATWRVNITNDETGDFARAFFPSEDEALNMVNEIALTGVVPAVFVFA